MKKFGTLIYILVLILCFSANLHAEEYSKSTIQVNGNGEVNASPDVAFLSVAVETNSPNASEAVRKNAEKTQAVIAQIKKVLGDKDKIKTTNYNLSPVYEYDDKTKKQYLKEYRVVNQVQVETLGIDGLGKIIDTATNVGANRINGPSFGIKNSSDLERKALTLAVEDAQKTAETVASASGVKIVKILRINPSYSVPMPYQDSGFRARAMSAESAPTPIESGDLTISADVTVVYEIE